MTVDWDPILESLHSQGRPDLAKAISMFVKPEWKKSEGDEPLKKVTEEPKRPSTEELIREREQEREARRDLCGSERRILRLLGEAAAVYCSLKPHDIEKHRFFYHMASMEDLLKARPTTRRRQDLKEET